VARERLGFRFGTATGLSATSQPVAFVLQDAFGGRAIGALAEPLGIAWVRLSKIEILSCG
jgi:hypothetical protein